MTVVETFFSILVADMKRATAFYESALGATVIFGTPGWTSLKIAGVRIGLALAAEHRGERTGLHFAVRELPTVFAAVERAGGKVVTAPVEVAPGVTIAEAQDTEGNTFTVVPK
jgi:predicted enzyme related to lactoylglutathione lyase